MTRARLTHWLPLASLTLLVPALTTCGLEGVPFVGAPAEGGCVGGSESDPGCYTSAYSPARVEARVIDPYPPDPWAAPDLFRPGPPVVIDGVALGSAPEDAIPAVPLQVEVFARDRCLVAGLAVLGCGPVRWLGGLG